MMIANAPLIHCCMRPISLLSRSRLLAVRVYELQRVYELWYERPRHGPLLLSLHCCVVLRLLAVRLCARRTEHSEHTLCLIPGSVGDEK